MDCLEQLQNELPWLATASDRSFGACQTALPARDALRCRSYSNSTAHLNVERKSDLKSRSSFDACLKAPLQGVALRCDGCADRSVEPLRPPMETFSMALAPLDAFNTQLDGYVGLVSSNTGLPMDQARYICCALATYPLALLFRHLPNVPALKVRNVSFFTIFSLVAPESESVSICVAFNFPFRDRV